MRFCFDLSEGRRAKIRFMLGAITSATARASGRMGLLGYLQINSNSPRDMTVMLVAVSAGSKYRGLLLDADLF